MARKLSRREMIRNSLVGAGAMMAAPMLRYVPKASIPFERRQVELELWAFVNTHARWFRSMAEDYKKDVNPDFELTVNEIAYTDLHDNLLISLQAGEALLDKDFEDMTEDAVKASWELKAGLGFIMAEKDRYRFFFNSTWDLDIFDTRQWDGGNVQVQYLF